MRDSPSPATDLDLVLVRSFTVLAEHRHFGRAAAALHLTASSLSRQITRLERQVGARLLDRTPQGTRLTEAGEVFLPLATEVLSSAGQAASRARAAAQPGVITIGFGMNLIITPAVRALRRQYPDADVLTLYLDYHELRTALLEHRVDAVVARLPFATDQLSVTILYDEPRVLAVPVDHRLAGKESVTMDDIADEPMPQSNDPLLNAFWRIDPRPDGSPAPAGPFVKAVEDKIELIAGERAVAIIPASARLSGLRPDLTTVPLEGVEPSHVALATRVGDRGRLVTAFRKSAHAHLTGPARAQRAGRGVLCAPITAAESTYTRLIPRFIDLRNVLVRKNANHGGTEMDISQLVSRYLETWNETDPAARRKAISDLWAVDGVYTDPMAVAAGPTEIDATIAAVQGQFPGLAFTLAGPVDAHHDIARFTWRLGEDLVIGSDVMVLDADSRISKVHGFLDKVPA